MTIAMVELGCLIVVLFFTYPPILKKIISKKRWVFTFYYRKCLYINKKDMYIFKEKEKLTKTDEEYFVL
ncbi:MAG: hypothetical protein NC433_01870 [Clostridiales bacterium]|nr:hypothetical protein [Clostridiales bacterium]